MTVAALNTRMIARFRRIELRMDARFRTVDVRLQASERRTDARMVAGFESVHGKLDAILKVVDDHYRHHQKIVDTYEDRLKDLERAIGR